MVKISKERQKKINEAIGDYIRNLDEKTLNDLKEDRAQMLVCVYDEDMFDLYQKAYQVKEYCLNRAKTRKGFRPFEDYVEVWSGKDGDMKFGRTIKQLVFCLYCLRLGWEIELGIETDSKLRFEFNNNNSNYSMKEIQDAVNELPPKETISLIYWAAENFEKVFKWD